MKSKFKKGDWVIATKKSAGELRNYKDFLLVYPLGIAKINQVEIGSKGAILITIMSPKGGTPDFCFLEEDLIMIKK